MNGNFVIIQKTEKGSVNLSRAKLDALGYDPAQNLIAYRVSGGVLLLDFDPMKHVPGELAGLLQTGEACLEAAEAEDQA